MATTTVLRMEIITEKPILPEDAKRLVKTANRVVDMIELTGIGEKIGFKSADIKLADKPV